MWNISHSLFFSTSLSATPGIHSLMGKWIFGRWKQNMICTSWRLWSTINQPQKMQFWTTLTFTFSWDCLAMLLLYLSEWTVNTSNCTCTTNKSDLSFSTCLSLFISGKINNEEELLEDEIKSNNLIHILGIYFTRFFGAAWMGNMKEANEAGKKAASFTPKMSGPMTMQV